MEHVSQKLPVLHISRPYMLTSSTILARGSSNIATYMLKPMHLSLVPFKCMLRAVRDIKSQVWSDAIHPPMGFFYSRLDIHITVSILTLLNVNG